MNTTKEKIAIYARVSPGVGAKERLDEQVYALVAYCKAKGYETSDTHIYTDMASVAGRGIEGRLGFTGLIEDAEAGKFKTVLVWNYDRLARSPISHGYLSDVMLKHPLRIITLDGKEYSSDDNLLLASVELGMTTQYIHPRKQGCNCNELR